jgi:uncharacterized membrane protein (DUF106 family)
LSSGDDKQYQVLLQLQKLQDKIFYDSVITFLITLVIMLLATFVINQLEKIDKYKEKIAEYQEKISKDNDKIFEYRGTIAAYQDKIAKEKSAIFNFQNNMYKMNQKMVLIQLINNLSPSIISIYALSIVHPNGNINFKKGQKKDETFYSLCHRINLHLDMAKKSLNDIKFIDSKNREIFLFYIGETIYKLKSYVEGNKLDSSYANKTIADLETLGTQIATLKVIDSDNSDENFQILQ